MPKDSVYYYKQKLYTVVGKTIKEKAIGFIIPYKNFQIQINQFNNYKRILNNIPNDGIDEIFSKTYIFHQNYYYLRGDNIINSIDSKKFGLVNEKDIIGKLVFSF